MSQGFSSKMLLVAFQLNAEMTIGVNPYASLAGSAASSWLELFLPPAPPPVPVIEEGSLTPD
jgi:hypothetical protein